MKKARKKKSVAKEVTETETNKHGVRVIGMTSRESVDGKAGSDFSGRTPTHKENIFS